MKRLVFLICILLLTIGVASAQDNITLVVWDIHTTSPQKDAIDQLNAEFEAAHPGVTIDRTSFTFEDLKTKLALGLSSDDGPDVSMVNQGFPDMGALVAADLLLPLNDYSTKYGWDKRWSAALLARNSFTADGKTFGEGNLYGVSTTAEIGGVFYHKDLFKQYNIEVPKTFEEFQAMLDKFVAAGVTPFAFGPLAGSHSLHFFFTIQHSFSNIDWLNDFIYRRNGATFDTPENLQAAQTVQEWASKYFTKDFSGIERAAARSDFFNKKYPLMIDGSWEGAEMVSNNLGDEVGFFLFPRHTDGEPPLAFGGWSLAWGVRKTSPNPDLAAEYVEWQTGPRAAEVWAGIGDVPATGLTDRSIIKYSVQNDILDAWNSANENNGVGHYLDWASPTIYDTMKADLEKLMAGNMTPEEFVKDVQNDYASAGAT
jgi:raffinose/stachyose/melibiose transport system substrate-binding protein